MKLILMCHSGICGHKEEIKDNEVKHCPICGDELVHVIVDNEENEVYE